MRKVWLLTAVWILVAAATSGARSTARLNGTVLDAKGAPVAARVFWQTSDGTHPHVLDTDAHGRFHVTHLRGGLYDLRAEAAGRWSEWEHNVVVRPGHRVSITLRLLRTTPPPARHPARQ